MGWIGILLIGWSVFFYDSDTPFPGLAAVLPCLGAALLIYFNAPKFSSIGKILSLKPMVFIGKISYSLYLWHWPVIVFLKYIYIKEVPTVLMVGALVLSFVLAWLSWKFIETPFRKKQVYATRRPLFVFAAVLSAVFIGLGAWLYSSGGVPSRFPPDVIRHAKEDNPLSKLRGLDQLERDGAPPIVGDTESSEQPRLLLWGDSHAMSLLPVLDSMGKEKQEGIYAAVSPGTPPIAGVYLLMDGKGGPDRGTQVIEFVKEKKIERVLITARWAIYSRGKPDGSLKRLVSDSETHATLPEQAREVFRRNLRKTIQSLQDLGVEVWLMRDVGYQQRTVPETVAQAASRGMDLNAFARPASVHREENAEINRLIDEAVEGLQVKILDPTPVFTDVNGL